jgi:cytochrome P450
MSAGTENSERRNRPRAHDVRLADLAVDPYPIFTRLRETEPVAWMDEPGLWLVTRRDDVVDVLRRPDTFRTDAPGSTIRDTFGDQMLSAEGERHRRYKSQCNPPFNTRAVRDHAVPFIEAQVHACLDEWAELSTIDLRPALASRLAVSTVASVLGIPSSLHETIRRWYADFAAALANFSWDEQIRARGQASAREFRATMKPLLDEIERTTEPSLLGTLGRHRTDRLSDDEIFSNALIVLFGGIETTEATLLNVIWALLQHPDILAAVRREPSLLPGAIDEAMRWEPAVQSCTRHVESPVTLRGVELDAGDVVQCMLGAANRDPAHFPNPDRYDITRANAGDHLSFGSGKHFCLGAALARAEVQVTLEILLRRFPALRADAERPSAPYGYEFRAPPTLDVVLRA